MAKCILINTFCHSLNQKWTIKDHPILDQGFMRQMLNTKIDTKCQFLYSLNPQIANLNYQFVDSIRWQVG